MFGKIVENKLTQYPTSVEELRKLVPGNIILPSRVDDVATCCALRSLGWVWVTDLPAPPYDPTKEAIVYTKPIKLGNKWYRSPVVKELSPTELDNTFTIKFSAFKEQIDKVVAVALEQKAKDLGYGDEHTPPITAICGYANTSIPQFKQEVESWFRWRDAIWLYCLNIQNSVKSGVMSFPTIEHVVANFPEFVMLQHTINL